MVSVLSLIPTVSSTMVQLAASVRVSLLSSMDFVSFKIPSVSPTIKMDTVQHASKATSPTAMESVNKNNQDASIPKTSAPHATLLSPTIANTKLVKSSTV